MNNSQMPSRRLAIRRRAQGYSLIELMIAIAVALFLLAGILLIEEGTHQTSLNQTGLAQLQDEERVAMSIISNVIQLAGYYPTPPGVFPKNELELLLPAVVVPPVGSLQA